MKVAIITTWRVNCGVATYTEELCDKLTDLVDLKVYAEVIHQQKQEDSPLTQKPIPYIRCWKRGETFDKLYDKIIENLPDIVHIQYERAMYVSEHNVLNFLDRLHKAEIKTVMTLHEVYRFNPTVYYADWYQKVQSHFITTNEVMDKELRKWYKDASSTIIPLGSTIFEPTEKLRAKRESNLSQYDYHIIQFGYYGFDKGMMPLIQAMPEILKSIPNAVLVFAGGIHPLSPPIHKNYLRKCIQTALKLNLQKNVMFPGEVLFGKEIDRWLSAADMIVLNHETVFGSVSASACGHRILCSGRPIVMNRDIRLSEFLDGIHCNKSKREDLAKEIIHLHKKPELQKRIVKGALSYAQKTSFENIAKQHLEVYRIGK